jgi:hypothetical protein
MNQNTNPQLVVTSKIVDLYIHSSIRLHGVVFNELLTGTILLLPSPIKDIEFRYGRFRKTTPPPKRKNIFYWAVWIKRYIFLDFPRERSLPNLGREKTVLNLVFYKFPLLPSRGCQDSTLKLSHRA